MRKKIVIVLIILVILALTASIFMLMPQYKQIEMSGYTFEVPNSNAEVKNNTINYNTYQDPQHDLTIKTWACKDINDTNGNVNGSIEMGTQLGENMGTNTTYKNFSVYNKSGIYTYYEVDIEHACIILITSNDLNSIEHILETMNKPKLSVDVTLLNLTDSGLIPTNMGNNTTADNLTNPTTKNSPSKKTSSGSGSNDGYRWSEQYGDYIKEYTDSNGVEHIDSKKGYKSSYNPKTNEFKEKNYEKLL